MRRLAVPVVVATTALLTLGMAMTRQAARSSEPNRPTDPNRWAVIVGVDHFQGRTHSNVGAVGDARTFTKVLTERGWDPQHVVLLTDGDATQANIRAAFGWLAQHASDRSFSVFHYSGHVHQQSIDGALHQQLWPHDNQFITDREFADAMRSVPGHIWIDVAGCEAGGFDDGVAAPNRLFTASSQVNEKSYENPSWHESVFTGMQVDQAIEQRMADNNHDGYVSINEAFGFAAAQAPQMTAHQSAGPQHPYTRGGDGTEWTLESPPE
jgi:glycosylphosphatidylinositol transamidase (GPIT) subunit GPI8